MAAAAAREERHREQEFYRYYHPVLRRAEKPPPSIDLNNPAKQHVAQSSPDTVLNAFCQLGALRLGTRRSMIFSFDSQHAYVLAEATRTLSLRDDDVHDSEDSLWLGYAVLPNGFSICEQTVKLPQASDSNTVQADSGMVHVINDLHDDARFRDQPFVTHGPKARFYAGVPLVTQKGIRIGAYCVFDDEPRDGLKDKEIKFLCQMSYTVMEHLEIIRSSMEFGQGSQMLISLDKFFKATDPARIPDSEQDMIETEEDVEPSPLHNTSSAPPIERIRKDKKTYAPPKAASRAPLSSSTGIDDELRHTFQSAARLVRDAADADGVMFLGPTKGHSDDGDRSENNSTEGGTDPTSTSGDTSTDSDGNKHRSRLKCTVWGYSSRSGNNAALKPLSSRLLRAMLHRYPQGKVWLFNAAGEGSSDSYSSASDSQGGRRTSAVSVNAETDQRKGATVSQASKLQAWLPGVRTLCLVTLFDPVRETAYAGCLVWSNVPSRVFSPQGELSYVRAFCEVVTSNVSRLEARKMDEMKTQFISSVSHELRSPLHGIIGSVDLIQEQEVLDWSIILQIEKCSTSLMDVIDHLLDYAKINNLVGGGNKEKSTITTSGSKGRKRHTEYSKPIENGNIKVNSLSQTTAEIVDVVYYSHCHSANAQQRGLVDFVLDVSTDLALEYTVPVGSWKRICMNIVSNALKYTTTGYVLVSLKIMQGARKIPSAVFTVKDTGCGMAIEFMENRLFRAFTQEDSLSAGTGLGMSLVAKLVKGLGGKIEVNSVKDVGTTFKVTVPLDVQTRYVSAAATIVPLEGLRVRVLESLTSDTVAKNLQRQLHLTSMYRTFRHLGATQVNDTADVDFIWESDLALYSQSPDRSAALAPYVIILCDTFMSAAHLRKVNNSSRWRQNVEFIARPYGPDRILQGISKVREPHEPDDRAQTSLSAPSIETANLSSAQLPAEETQSTKDVAKDSSMSTKPDKIAEVVEPFRRGAQMRLHELGGDKILPSSDEKKTLEDASYQSPTEDLEMAGLSLASPEITSSGTESPFVRTTMEKSSIIDQLSLLLVDDNRINLRLLTTYANRNSHPWLSASDGAEAVEVYKSSLTGENKYNNKIESQPTSSSPEVVFMDINMPVMDGFEATRRIRELETAEGLRSSTVVALTGLGSDDAREEANKSGIDIFLTKPVRQRELKKLLQEIGETRSRATPASND